jgi:hypothetical protein
MLLFHKNSKYQDIRLFLWLIPLINVINYYLTYQNIGFSGRTILTFSIDTVTGYIAWLVVRAIILWMDRKFPYDVSPPKRIGFQIVLTLFAGSLTIILITEIVNFIATSKPVPHTFYTTDIFIISIWFFVLNGIYIGLHYYNQWQLTEANMKQIVTQITEGFKVSTSKKDLLLDFDEIAGFYVDGDYD